MAMRAIILAAVGLALAGQAVQAEDSHRQRETLVLRLCPYSPGTACYIGEFKVRGMLCNCGEPKNGPASAPTGPKTTHGRRSLRSSLPDTERKQDCGAEAQRAALLPTPRKAR
jgi:hypothetical protein